MERFQHAGIEGTRPCHAKRESRRKLFFNRSVIDRLRIFGGTSLMRLASVICGCSGSFYSRPFAVQFVSIRGYFLPDGFCASFAQESLSVTVRLKTRRSEVLSLSRTK